MLGSQIQTSPKEAPCPTADRTQVKSRYFMVWRWHFYAGLYVIPFMIMLSLTGLVMLFDDEIESIRYHDELTVVPESAALPVSLQLDKVQKAYPLGKVTQYIPSKDPSLANKFDVRLADGRSVLVTTNQYTGEVIGEIDRSDSWYQLANDIHGTLLMGQWGDYLIEIAASLSILLIMTGVYLWWPRDNASKAGFFKIRLSNMRLLMRDLHANFAALFSFVLLFFLLSGLAWTSVWGAKLVQAWILFLSITLGAINLSLILLTLILTMAVKKNYHGTLNKRHCPNQAYIFMVQQPMLEKRTSRLASTQSILIP